jgi:hypothetical protein
LTFADRYIVLVAGYRYPQTRLRDGTVVAEESDRMLKPELPGSILIGPKEKFQKTVLVYDTSAHRLGTADSLIEQTSYPSSVIVGDRVYCLGGEGGPRLWHPATLQIGRVSRAAVR